jgi:hypothetical protein
MMATRTLREYALDLGWMSLERSDNNVVRLSKRMRNRIEELPKAEWWDLSRSQDGSERLEIRVGRRYYYIYYWTRYLIDGHDPDWAVRIPKDSVEGKRIAEMLHDA